LPVSVVSFQWGQQQLPVSVLSCQRDLPVLLLCDDNILALGKTPIESALVCSENKDLTLPPLATEN
jgi:hypothetical protein